MSEWDVGRVFYTNVNNQQGPQKQLKTSQQKKFKDFIRTYNGDGGGFAYRDQLKENFLGGRNFLEVSLDQLRDFERRDDDLDDGNPKLAELLQNKPAEYLPLFELAAQEVAKELTGAEVDPEKSIGEVQILLKTTAYPSPLRSLKSGDVSRLVCIPGIAIGASRVRAKATYIHIMCRNCRNSKLIACRAGFGGAQVPRVCDRPKANAMEAPCPIDPYIIIGDKCKYVDQQTIKLQERPEAVPTGEMPRNMLVSVDRTLVEKIVPGTRVTVVGIYSIFSQSSKNVVGNASIATRSAYIRACGLQIDAENGGRSQVRFTPEEEQECIAFSREPNLYDRIVKNIAPAIWGHEDIKRSIACLLFSGARKHLPDGMRIRGDINILLLGDPSTAKSQFLKFVEKVAPIGVYTSGKGSSAAGLTASVIKDSSSGDFYLEGGAMVLADNGVVCIDEFDKMRPQDRVAIHEAMEQQTISIAKAGITTILNSRTSVLAAANPKFGSYDDMKDADEQIEFAQTILSRFDLIYIVRDIRNEERDMRIARHVVNIHISAVDAGTAQETDLDLDFLKRYISYARAKCSPRLSEDSAEMLMNHYVTIRKEAKEKEMQTGQMGPIPITVRQLEAVTRISEALAKMTLSLQVSVQHVKEAIRLFRGATLEASNAGIATMDGQMKPEEARDVEEIERQIKRRMAINSKMNTQHLLEYFKRQRFSEGLASRTVRFMIQRGELEFLAGRKIVRRLR
mmetsp:Transcript_8613/g.14611  ORF Transcript_8613/g.14611 Transcript_8613/m.14611 type:complete len:736 (+) Transcript_8613:124-2331(+)